MDESLLFRAMAHVMSHAIPTGPPRETEIDGYMLAPFLEFINHSEQPNCEFDDYEGFYGLPVSRSIRIKRRDQITLRYWCVSQHFKN